ncbi:hypothetical protein SNOG_02024 [Parastagonospora nodorum SN15]|uniref:Major facilitator superfamily (MFS) profile domain-containing protein n=1 Tax=Phaeosphaeria nodorum (strain SN15 / ATCC MYA-4574 / FGSC 10173) TaxID=321614 RepID=Q0V1U0_PHANO|nr:hypothetical protein SNOG_02024 [Parastagonospora nodorum SN15]EAT90236.2 hypothetical protein SNOG_02024 [Parastagonospora nodorum SN15]
MHLISSSINSILTDSNPTAEQESSRTAYLRALDKDVETSSDPEKEAGDDANIEEVATHSPVTSSTPSVTSNEPPPQRHVIRFEENDPENPNNWSMPKKCYALFVAIMSVMNSTMSSSLASGATPPISKHFGTTSEYLLILPTSMFLVGYVFGPMAWGPLSESDDGVFIRYPNGLLDCVSGGAKFRGARGV